MNENTGTRRTTRFRLDAALDALDEWSETATEEDLDALYTALFAIADESVCGTYEVVDDPQRLNEFVVVVKPDLMLKIKVRSFDSFGILQIGSKRTGCQVA